MEDLKTQKFPQIINLLSGEDLEKIKEYLPYITCDKCKNIMLSANFCPTCKKDFCKNCDCGHKDLKPNRHLNNLINSIEITCKFTCGKPPFKLHSILNHIEYDCIMKDSYNLYNNSDDYENKIQKEDQKITTLEFGKGQFKIEDLLDLDFDKIIQNFSEGNVNNEMNIICYKCSNVFNDKISFMKHFINCMYSNIPQNPNNEYSKDTFQNDLRGYREMLAKYINEKIMLLSQLYYEEAIKGDEEIKELVKQREENSKILEELIQRNKMLSSGKNIEALLQKDEEYKSLKEKEEELEKEKKRLEKELSEENYNMIGQKYQLLEQYKNTNKEEIKNMIGLQQESNVLVELISNYSTSIQGECSNCKDPNSEKIICTFCKKRLCKHKCAFKCKEKDCPKFLCPDCTGDCKLCHKKLYCDSCKKKCYSSSCSNKFCPECYKLNEHQAGKEEDSCKYFVCEDSENNSDCLMTTLFCPKCQKRKCNKCLIADREHYPFIKIFD